MKSWQAYAPAGLLAVFFLLVTTAAATKSATYDESVHIYSGWRILTAGDFATNHEHPPLMKAIAALPLVLTGAKAPRGQVIKENDQWAVAHDFVYHANDGDRILMLARAPIALLAVLMAWLLHRHALALMGPAAALAALALLVFEPNILAHAEWVTTDLGMTAMGFMTFLAFLRHMRARSRNSLLLAGSLFGLSLLTKFTAVLLGPILALCGLLIVWLEGSGRWKDLLISLAAIGGIGLVVLNLGYGFGGTFSTLRSFAAESATFRGYAAGSLGNLPLPLPVEYVRGFDHAEAGGQQWWAYLFGRYSQTGWRHYYLAALAVKTPLQLLLLAAVALVAWPRALGRPAGPAGRRLPEIRSLDALLWQVPLLVFLFAFTLSGNLKNIGLRYILPIYPFLCLLGGLAARLQLGSRWWKWVVGGLVAWQAVMALWIHPDYLAFFNLTVGGPSRGREVLLDSNLDWGQDLKGLGRFIRQRGIETIYVDYFGRGCMGYYGVRSTPDFEGGWIAVSATNLKGVYSQDRSRYSFLWDLEPAAVIGRSIFVYDVPRPAGWVPRAAPPGGDP